MIHFDNLAQDCSNSIANALNLLQAPLVSFALSHPFCYLSPSEHDVILRIHHCCACSFLFGWPPCQRSDMTLVEVSQHAYNCLFIRTIVLFVFLRNSCEPDMVLVYFCWINSVWVWVWVCRLALSHRFVYVFHKRTRCIWIILYLSEYLKYLHMTLRF